MCSVVFMDTLRKLFDKAEECVILDPFINILSIPRHMYGSIQTMSFPLQGNTQQRCCSQVSTGHLRLVIRFALQHKNTSISPIFCEDDVIGEYGSILNCPPPD